MTAAPATRVRTRPHGRARGTLLSLVAVSGLLLSGCGVSPNQLRPGVAAQVDDQTLTTSHADEVVDGVCQYFADNEDAAPAPRAAIRNTIVSSLVQQLAAQKLVEDYDLDLGEEYRSQLQDVESFAQTLPEDQAEPLTDANRALLLLQTVAVQVGTQLLEDEGQPSDDPQAAQTRGLQAVADVLKDGDVDLNPVYGLTVDDEGQVVPSDGLAVPVSEEATRAQTVADLTLESPDVLQAAEGLPASQLC